METSPRSVEELKNVCLLLFCSYGLAQWTFAHKFKKFNFKFQCHAKYTLFIVHVKITACLKVKIKKNLNIYLWNVTKRMICSWDKVKQSCFCPDGHVTHCHSSAHMSCCAHESLLCTCICEIYNKNKDQMTFHHLMLFKINTPISVKLSCFYFYFLYSMYRFK